MDRMNKALKAEIRARLDQMEAEGELTPSAVVREGQDKKSPIHRWPGWTWDTQKAAEEHWIDQARTLMQSFTITVHKQTHVLAAPMYVRDIGKPLREQGYISTMSLLDDKAKARLTITYELERAVAHVQRARALSAALGLEKEARKLEAQLLAFQDEVNGG